MRIVFLTHYFPPEANAPASRVFESCRRWVRWGHDVTVVTCAPNVPSGKVYPGYRNYLSHTEELEGIQVIRVWTLLAPNQGFFRRTLNYLSFMVAASLRSLFLPPFDLVVATSPQFFCGWAGWVVARLRRRPFLLEIRDLWPESIKALGALRSTPLLAILEFLETRLYIGADHIVTVGEGYKQGILRNRVPGEKVSIVPNGVDRERWNPALDGEDFRRRHGLQHRFVCSYVGTIGMAAGLEVALEAAAQLRLGGRLDIHFIMVGDGADRRALEDRRNTESLDNVHFLGRVPRESVPEVLAASDVVLVHLRDLDLFQLVIPSKIFEAAAMEKAILLGVRGRAGLLVKEAGAGLLFTPEDADDLVATLLRLVEDTELRRSLGRNGRDYVLRHHDWDDLARQYIDLAGAHLLDHAHGSPAASNQ